MRDTGDEGHLLSIEQELEEGRNEKQLPTKKKRGVVFEFSIRQNPRRVEDDRVLVKRAVMGRREGADRGARAQRESIKDKARQTH